MKTKKTAKIISSVLALVMLVCSLSAVSGFVTSAENEANTEAKLVNALKTSWTKMYTNDFFATLKSDNNINTVTGKNDTVIDNPTVDENKTYATGDEVLGLNLNATYYNLTFYNKGGKYECYSLSDKIKNYDTITLSFYTGEITGKGTLTVSVIDNKWRSASIKHNLEVSDSGKWIDVDILKSLGYATMSEFVNREDNSEIPNAMNVSFSNALKANGFIIGMVAGKTFAKLPDNSDSMTALELYKEAEKIDAFGYIDSADFASARDALKTYLKPQILKSELTTAWSSMYVKTNIADVKTDKVLSSFSDSAEPATMGLSFNADNTVNKTASTHDEKNTGVIFKVKSGYFNSSNTDYKYEDVFNDANNDTLSVTLKIGTVTAPGDVYLLRTFTDYNSVESTRIPITIDDSGKEITLDARKLFGDKKLSELLSDTTQSGTTRDLKIIKIGFSKGLSFENTEISGLNGVKYVKAATADNDELLAGKSLRINTAEYANTVEFAAKREEFYNSLMTGKTLGDVNGLGDTNNICDLVALNDLMPEGYDTDNTYSITGDMNTDGYITAEDTALLRAELLK